MIEIRTPLGMPVEAGDHNKLRLGTEQSQNVLDEVVLDGQVIGNSFRGSNIIHWRVPKSTIPKRVINQAVWLLQARNRKWYVEQQLRITG